LFALEPQAPPAGLKACFDPWWPFPKLTLQHIDLLYAGRGRAGDPAFR
jgi:hypothetical protein